MATAYPRLLAHWVHDLNPYIFQIGERFGLRWYSLAYIAGFIAAWLMLRWYHRRGRSPFDPGQQEFIFIALFAGVLVGGRLGYMLLYDFAGFARDPLRIFRVWEGGMASHGGFIGVFCAIWIISVRTRVSIWRTGDIICTLVPPGILFGRVANFINGELWGRPSDLPWAVIFPQSGRVGVPLDQIVSRHPSQLYAAFLEGIVLLLYTQWRFWRKAPGTPGGQIVGEFMVGYALVRTVGELFREPDAPLILGVSRGAFYSLFVAVAGAVIIYMARRRSVGRGSEGRKGG